jgi:hypothetical protein
LVLLNDPTYVEAARAFAERLMTGATATEDRIQLGFRLALSRAATAAEVKVLAKLFSQHLEQYRQDKKAAENSMRVGDRAVPAGLDVSDLAAWTSVTRVLLNLHETITRE